MSMRFRAVLPGNRLSPKSVRPPGIREDFPEPGDGHPVEGERHCLLRRVDCSVVFVVIIGHGMENGRKFLGFRLQKRFLQER